jgi:Domain of unknown function (DUF5050)/Phosphatidylinositol-specific phospholipase C, X domain
MDEPLYPDCGEHFAIWADYIYFQVGSGGGLHRMPCRGSTNPTPLHSSSGYLAAPGDSYVYFQGGSTGLYRVPCDGSAKATPLHNECGNLVVPGDGFVYFQAGSNGLYRVPCDGSAQATPLYNECGEHLAVWNGYVYFQAGSGGPLARVRCDGGGKPQQLDPHSGLFAVPGDGYVYFHSDWSGGLYRVPCDGSAFATQLDENGGHLVVPGDGYVYFQAGGKGLYRVPCDASSKAFRLDPNCDRLVVFGDGYVYFQAGSKGLYRVRCDGKDLPATRLDRYCGNLVAAQGYIYFHGNPQWTGLYRVGVAIPSAPPGLKIRVQDEYVVNTVLTPSIDHKYNVIKILLDEASQDSSDTWFLNYTSGGSTGAYPDAVAGRINGRVATYLKTLAAKKQNRLGTIVMDFPDDYGKTALIEALYNYNSTSRLAPQDWMAAIPDQKKLSEITIPGTHDSCTFKASVSPMSRCQNLTLPEQLAAGIRFIDIRCRHFHDKFELHHGREYLGLDFDYVLDACRPFLRAHRRECIIMSVKEEHDAAGNKKTFEEVFDEYVRKDPDLWYLGNTIPALLPRNRGKVVLLRRFYIAPDSDRTRHGIDLTAWVDNATFTWPF